MSQHIIDTRDPKGRMVTVTMGYDRPLDYVFCTVIAAEEGEDVTDIEEENDGVIYSNLDDQNAGIEQQDVEYYREILHALGLDIPQKLSDEVKADQKSRVGNRNVKYSDGRL